jgi:hypothetical protein
MVVPNVVVPIGAERTLKAAETLVERMPNGAERTPLLLEPHPQNQATLRFRFAHLRLIRSISMGSRVRTFAGTPRGHC